MDTYNVIGIMSGTSLDGLDVCFCSFFHSNNCWQFHINYANTTLLPDSLKSKLKSATNFSALEMTMLNNELGNFIGNSILTFIQKNNIDKTAINFISSHGHTIFHQPENKLTVQIGNGANISAITKLPVICDFRSNDIALSGQGAPLVPIGDEFLFSEYDYCINLGGIANISYKKNNKRIAFDICPVNIVLNKLAQKLGYNYDNRGKIASSGNINIKLLDKLNNLAYYKKNAPKSLGIEWIEKAILPILSNSTSSIEDKLCSFIEHIAIQISKAITTKNKTIFFTGGGVFNDFLMQIIKAKTNNNIIIPPKEIIEFKEALIFGFLGVLRWRKEPNCLQSVTGAINSNIGGCIYHAF